MIGMGKRKGNLYFLDLDIFHYVSHQVANVCKQQSLSNGVLWHTRLGHPSFHRMQVLKSILGVTNQIVSYLPCTICPLAK